MGILFTSKFSKKILVTTWISKKDEEQWLTRYKDLMFYMFLIFQNITFIKFKKKHLSKYVKVSYLK